MSQALIFLCQALVIIALPVAVLRFSGLRGRVPLVVIQILTGIALGPSLFGRVAPEIYGTFFNPVTLAPLSGIASVAVLIFGLITGLHFDVSIFRSSGRLTSMIVAANIILPILLGCLGAMWILFRHPGALVPGLNPAYFVVAIGVCAAVTALPVLGELLREMRLLGSRMSDVALAVAGIKDFILYIMLALLLTPVAGHSSSALGVLASVILVPAYLLVMIKVVRPLLGKMLEVRLQDGAVQERALVLVGAVTIASALAVESMGLSYILGAFIAGAIMPMNLRAPILARLQAPTLALMMPFFFTMTGLRTFIDPQSLALVEIFVIATLASVIGIVGGTALVARYVGETWRFAFGLGFLLQTKGLVEIVVLTILLDAGIITDNVFGALVLMAVFSTAVAMPLARMTLNWGKPAPTTRQNAPSR